MTPTLYRALTRLAGPLIYLLLLRRRVAGREDPARFGERMGRPGLARPAGPLAWLHAASVGEARSVLTLIARVLAERPALHLLVTSGTVTSAAMLAECLPDRAFHQYVPVDRPDWVRRFLDHWRPELALWVESELWPNLVGETRARGVPMVLVNGRISARSYAGWQRAPRIARSLLSGFALAFAQSNDEAERLRHLGAASVQASGNLKFAADPLPADGAALDRLRAEVGDRPLWLAASTHPGEEAMVGAVHRRLAPDRPGLLTLVVPRHARRGAEIAAELRAAGLGVAVRSEGQPVRAETDILLADTMGELGLFYRLAPVVLVGGSLIRHGGQNLIEPARLGCAILHGPHMHNFAEIVAEMAAAGATTEVAGTDGLARALDRLLRDPAAAQAQAEAARRVAERGRDTLEAVLAGLGPHLDRLCPREESRARA